MVIDRTSLQFFRNEIKIFKDETGRQKVHNSFLNISKKNSPGNTNKAPLILVLIGVVCIYFIFFQGDHGLIRYWKLVNEKKRLINEINALQAEQVILKHEIELLRNNYDYIEKIARERFKMGRDGEKIYLILDEPAKK